MRRARKTDPTLAAEFRAKRRSVSQIPTNSLAAKLHASAAFVLTNPVLANLQEERNCPTVAQSRAVRIRVPRTRVAKTHVLRTGVIQNRPVRSKAFDRKSLNPSLRLPFPRKPPRPNLHRLPLRIARAPAPPRIHQQIPEPPSPAPIAQPHPQKPNLIPPPHREQTEPLVKRLHTSGRITPVRLVQTRCGDSRQLLNSIHASPGAKTYVIPSSIRPTRKRPRLIHTSARPWDRRASAGHGR